MIESHFFYKASNEGAFIQRRIPTEASYLTLVGGAAADASYDRMAFAYPQITKEALPLENVTKLKVAPAILALPVGSQFPVYTIGEIKGGALDGLRIIMDPHDITYESSAPNFVTVDTLGVAHFNNKGLSQIKVRLGEFASEVTFITK